MTEIIQKIISIGSRGTAIFLRKNTQDINTLEKYAQIGKLSSGLIHDLISPITALNIQLETSDEKLLNNSEFLKSIKAAVVNVNNYSDLIKNYISGNREKRWLFLDEEIQKAVELISYNAVRNEIQIQFIRKKGIKIFANSAEIYQIMISLISNAIESFKESSPARKIIIKLDHKNDKTILLIKDFGRGIENINRIFDRFYTTKKDEGGTGIGLSSVKDIIENSLNGNIEIETEIDKGTSFKIII